MNLPDTNVLTQPGTDAAWLEPHWMPYTGNRNFKANPRMMVSAEGCYYTDVDGRKIFDGLSGLWCCGLGHGRAEITEAARQQLATLDYSPAFQYGHPLSFALANKLKELTPEGLDYVFFTGSGSESADTSLKLARAYWRAKGQSSKSLLIGRERATTGSTLAAFRSVASVRTARPLVRVLPLTTCRTPSCPATPLCAACLNKVPNWPTNCCG